MVLLAILVNLLNSDCLKTVAIKQKSTPLCFQEFLTPTDKCAGRMYMQPCLSLGSTCRNVIPYVDVKNNLVDVNFEF